MKTNRVNSTPLVSSETSKVTCEKKSSGLCAQLVYGTANCVKHFSLGVAAASIVTPLTSGVSYFAKLRGLIPNVTRESQIRWRITDLQNKSWKKFNIENLLKAPCFYQEFAKQSNLHLGSDKQVTVLKLKVRDVMTAGVLAPIIEEIIFRGLIQDVLLTRIAKYVIRKVAPGKEAVLDSTIAKIARITLIAIAFSASHLQNSSVQADSFVSKQLVVSFVGSIAFGILKESKAGLLGSIGAHITNNIVAMPLLLEC